MFDREWQRSTALRHIKDVCDRSLNRHRTEISELNLAKMAAEYVGARPEDVLQWMRGRP
jgi:hypothetical protein